MTDEGEGNGEGGKHKDSKDGDAILWKRRLKSGKGVGNDGDDGDAPSLSGVAIVGEKGA
jgi:hypothetical protein